MGFQVGSEPQDRRKVVITGYGAITPVGLTVDDFWASLVNGRSGISDIKGFDASDLPVRIGAEVKEFDPGVYMPHKVSRRIDVSTQYGVAAAMQAVQQAKLEVDEELAPRVGVYVGSSAGPATMNYDTTVKLHERGARAVSPFFFATSGSEATAGEIALWLGACGPSASLTTACASGATSIGEAMRLIQFGVADVMVAGGTEAPVTRLNIAAAAACRALSRRNDAPGRACRPFDKDRDGFVMGAGAGVLVLEEAEHARRRGATVLAELVGYGATTDAYHLTAPHPEGLGTKRAMRIALESAGLRPEDVDYVNAHGTSTELNDTTEIAALRDVLGDRALQIPVSSTKSMTGHLISGTGAVELIASVKAIQDSVVPPTLNCEVPEDDQLNFVPDVAQKWDTDVAMSNSFGFGGHNAVLIVRRWEQEGSSAADEA
ncbi:beta-ketoacyl-ACP synthase II [Streptomyces sp. NRRL F-5135]|uniref:beta-ketoacyl-ACP synthase II n=1 Tax=Streptomyces sp. NRRL F-5135 TaxID=1463858 RepID=UPI0004CA6522|nr:beta-ketoacyl-ACP synthase II [Streptomyces sp. NRRL F-5135]